MSNSGAFVKKKSSKELLKFLHLGESLTKPTYKKKRRTGRECFMKRNKIGMKMR
jgi:hypothetical protein